MGFNVFEGDCEKQIGKLKDGTVQTCITSPPYAEQRKGTYGGIPPWMYPGWVYLWAEALKPKLVKGGTLVINISPHVEKGVVSDYVMRTRLELRAAGWKEHPPFIWVKTSSPPIGNSNFPRRSWEEILWFSLGSPYINCKSLGKLSGNISCPGGKCQGFLEPGRPERRKVYKPGIARDPDILYANPGSVTPGVNHPAMMPASLAEQMVKRFSRPGDVVLDPFMGSGTTGIAALKLGRAFVGIDKVPDYCNLARGRLKKTEAEFDSKRSA
jgi:site-specific DNA-methyltransferase (adenine-specific)